MDNIIEELMSKMTLEEKVSMCHGNGLFRTEAVERLDIPALKMSDGPMGVRKEFTNDKWLPIGNSDDFVTYLPCNTALAATWNTELAYASGKVLGAEARGRGKDIILAPGINIHRSPMCGRNFEYMSEDPYLVSRLAVPFIKGVQESDVAACVKHFALNNQETERLNVNVEVDERTLREIYLPGFEAAVKEADSYTIMSAYNKFRGEHCSHNQYLLNDLLKGEWEYEGVVISDWGAVHDTYEAACKGLDIEMNVTDNFDNYYLANPLLEKIRSGEVKEKVIDVKVSRILKLMFKLKMFSEDRAKGAYNTSEHREKALKAARESIVLLKNENSMLPLDEKKLKTLAVIGDNAEKLHSNGGGSAEIKALYEISPLMGLKMKLGGNVKVNFARGYSDKEEDREKLLLEAVEAAENADAVVIIGGLNHDFDTEGADRKDMKLPYGQDELISRVLEANKNTAVVILSGSPVEMDLWLSKAPAVVQSWYAGMEGGTALAEVLLGEVNPSGKLPVTFPKTLADSPVHKIGEFPGDSNVSYKEGFLVGYRYFTTREVEPLFCFGHGLSYTSFKYSDLNISVQEAGGDVKVKVSFNIENTGDREGAETAQLYISDAVSTVERPAYELKGFSKVFLKPGEKKAVEINLDKSSLAFYSEAQKSWLAEAGEFEVLIGSSSEDIRLRDKFETSKDYIYN